MLDGALGAVLVLLAAAAGAEAPQREDAAAAAATPYRSVAIFGDTQDLTTGRAGGEEVLGAMVQWVLDHRERENIEFVLHVGDLVHRGAAAPEEWERFDAQWRRLDGVVPYAIVRGNHDNSGLDDPERPGFGRRGFAQYFGVERVAELPGYLASYPGGDDVAHAWRFALGDLPVLVIGLSWAPSQRQLAWADSLLREHPDTPAIALSHRFYHGVPVDHTQPLPSWRRLVAEHPAQVFMAVAGHAAPGEVAMLQLEGHPLLRVRTNFQQHARHYDAEGQSYLNLVRFYLPPDGRDEVEIVAHSPLRGRHPLGRVHLPRQRFELRGRLPAPERRAEP